MPKKTAVILFNLGGPDSLEAVKPFLFNLFYDKNIITIPNPFRWILAKFISTKRDKIAKDIYKLIGGKSPILEESNNQAKSLEKSLNKDQNNTIFKTFIIMRYWHPRAQDVIQQVSSFAPDKIILLPLYPQFSTTTSKSSIEEWKKYAQQHPKISDINTSTICCFHSQKTFISAHVENINKHISEIKDPNNWRLLFSAHGLPEHIIKNGDPYQWQVEQTVSAITKQISTFEYKVCYQSKVGRAKWITPSTEDEIHQASKDKKNLIIIPIAFVSEHSETLVELDIEYKELASSLGIKNYIRIPSLSTNEKFISSLAHICINLERSKSCPKTYSKCYCRNETI